MKMVLLIYWITCGICDTGPQISATAGMTDCRVKKERLANDSRVDPIYCIEIELPEETSK